VKAVHAVEAVAGEVVQEAETSGQLVTMSMVARVLDQLGSHRLDCRCGLCGDVVAKARPAAVFRTAQVWQRQTALTRARAMS